MKKLNKFFAILVALAMMATLCVSMAFAADTNAITGGTKDAPAQATLTKTLTMPEGVTNPNKEFTFNFAQTIQDTTADGFVDDGYVDAAAAVNNIKITPTTKTTDTTDEGTVVGEFNNVFGTVTWPKAGVYEYTVTENYPEGATETITDTINDGKTTITETYKYSKAEYKVYVGVASDNGTLYVESISVKQTKDDNGDPINPAVKVPATDPTEGSANGFNFKNEYNKTVKNTPQDPTQDPDNETNGDSLVVEKKIVNKDGSDVTTEQKAKAFRVNVTVTFPANGTMTEYVGKVGETEYKFKKAEPATLTQVVELKAGERLVFTDIEYGATYKVVEDAYPAYTASYDKDASQNALTVNDDKNDVNGSVITNNYDKDKDPATGLSIANLPFIVLALVAVGGLVAYVVVRRKSEDNA